jgi:hypothetical protein
MQRVRMGEELPGFAGPATLRAPACTVSALPTAQTSTLPSAERHSVDNRKLPAATPRPSVPSESAGTSPHAEPSTSGQHTSEGLSHVRSAYRTGPSFPVFFNKLKPSQLSPSVSLRVCPVWGQHLRRPR